MKHIKQFESEFIKGALNTEILYTVCCYLEDLMPRIKGFKDCLYGYDPDIKNECEFSFYFNADITEDEEF